MTLQFLLSPWLDILAGVLLVALVTGSASLVAWELLRAAAEDADEAKQRLDAAIHKYNPVLGADPQPAMGRLVQSAVSCSENLDT